MKTPAETTTVGLLLTNLRLLDLPQQSDLPINAEVFSLGKNKSRAFEHIVYHIFNRYDPVETKSRFSGAWPIYEPAQSKTFRAAAINWLGDLKKTSTLHSAVTIRKSMFDECQGDRYEELLLALSTMALRKVVEREPNGIVGNPLAFDEAVSLQPNADTMSALSIAYQSSLRNMLQRRFVDKQRWFLASRRLDEQKAMASEKEQAAAIAHESRRNLEAKEKDIISIWEKNWTGDQAVYKLLSLEQSNDSEQQLWSSASFQRLLKTGFFNKGNPSGNSTTALQKVEEALITHQNRLLQWEEFSERFLKERSGSKRSMTGKKVSFAADVGGGLGIDFNKHQNLHASAFTLQEGTQLPLPSTDDDFGKLFNSMRKELQTIRVSRRKLGTLSYANTYGEHEEEEDNPVPLAEPKQQPTAKDITEAEALKLLTAHLPVDTTPLKRAHLDSGAATQPLVAAKSITVEKDLQIANHLRPSPEAAKLIAPKRLRSPPPPIELAEPTHDDKDDSETAPSPQDSPPGIPNDLQLAVESKVILPGDRNRSAYEEEDSVDEHMVEKMIFQITTSTDTPAPTRPRRIFADPTWSKEELEEDPFKPRPKVALSPLLTPYEFQQGRRDRLETPKLEFSPFACTEDKEDEDLDPSPSKGRGRGHR
ncbi:hypothetical protein DRE_03328 [Drechslerella stenobrocha 248]|uniref:HAUS augmin-like complex subunit 6 N-terminal domain-containing protein n=1 Tax=Drechslerella stenobrocha 248 TaxID=1043628 RepID=W7HUM5_9PEZI|nr:hypothetical protein DRE_03328 [Drechslerella stenobrocha 248]